MNIISILLLWETIGKENLKSEGVEVIYLPRTPEISSSQMKKDLYNAAYTDGESKISHDDINTDPT